MHALGAELFFIGTGEPYFARGFRDEFAVSVPIWVDPAALSYRALAFKRGLGATFSGAVLRNAKRAMAAGHRQSRTKGAPMQQGGVLVVMPSGDVVYRYASEVAGDHPPVADVLSALEAAIG